MKADRYPESYFEKLSTDPILLKPFDPESKRNALAYGKELNILLSPFSVHAELFGSTELEITGKGEWEFGIWLDDQHWYPVLTMLINHFRSIHFLSDDFALFNDQAQGTEIEIIPMRGEAAARNQALMKYWRSNPKAVQAYHSGKIAHAYSRREYYRWKNNHISDIVESL
jgi:GrpB-like predicted nucleotidyltransferase (UPF0157 family)